MKIPRTTIPTTIQSICNPVEKVPDVGPFKRAIQQSIRRVFAVALVLLSGSLLHAGTWSQGTGLFNNITLGALQNSAAVNRQWTSSIDYDVDPASWTYDVYVPPGYDGTKPYGVVVYITSDPWPGIVLQTASNDKNLIWIAPRNVGNDQGDYTLRFGASLLALYRAKELFNIDARRVYTSGKSGGARVASALAFLHPEIIKGTAPSAGVCVPRLSAVSPDYLTKPTLSTTPESFYDYSNLYFAVYGTSQKTAIHATARTQKMRSYIMGRENDYREEYFVESFHCAYEPQGQACFLYNAPGEHTDPSDAEMKEAIDYLDRDDLFPVNANITAGAGGFAGMTNISQSGASAVEATAAGKTTYTLAPTLSAVAAAKTNTACYWDNTNGSTVRWLWEVKNAAPTNQKTSFGLWFANETWGGGVPTSVTAGSNPGILVTITQNGSQNRMVISARPDSGGETVFYDGTFSFSSAYSTAWTSPQTGYLTGTGSPVEMRMDLNQKRWQLTFNGIVLGTTTSIASGTHVSRDNKRQIFGYWDSATAGAAFWKHDIYTAASNTWSPFTKSIFTAATGALSGSGGTPSPMELRYVVASDPGLPDPPQPGPTGLSGTSSNGVVNLTWNAFGGATSYTIQRSSVSGGPYTTIQSGISGTSYTDSTVTSGNIYYYTLFATTASGDTAIVPELAVGVGFALDTWVGSGADNNWQTTANWTALPVAGDSLVFSGTTRLANTSNFPASTSFRDLMFSSAAGAFTLGGNAITLTKDVANNGTATQTVNLPVALTTGAHTLTTNTGNLSMGGVISGNGSVSKDGSGTATLSGANTYNGGTTINAGTLNIGSGTAVGTLGATGSTITQNAGTLTFAQTTASTNVAFASNLVLNGGTINAVNDGRYTLGSGTAGAAGTNTIAVNGSTTFASNWGDKGLAFGGILSGTGAITVQNTGGHNNQAAQVVFLNNSNTYSGTVTATGNFSSGGAGAIIVGGNNALQFADVVNNVTGGGTNGNGVIFNVTAPVFGSLAGSGNFILAANTNVFNASTPNASGGAVALTFGGNNASTTYSGVISGAGSVIKTGTGILALTGANTYSGGTTVTAGTLLFGNSNAFDTGAVTLNGGTVKVGGQFTLASNIAVSSASTFDMAGNNTTLSGTLSGSAALTLNNSGNASTLAFSGSNSGYSGTITINNGNAVSFTSANAGSANAAWVFNDANGDRVRINISGTNTLNFGSISGSGQIQNDTAASLTTLSVGGLNTSTTFGGTIKNNGTGILALVKTGTGTLTLTGANTLSGNLTINGGTIATGLALGNPGTNASQSSGLGDIGTSVSRTLTVNNGGTLSLAGGNVLGTGGSTNTLATTTLVVNQGGVFQSGLNGSGAGWWNKLGPVNLNGGTIRVGSGANTTSFQGLALIGTVTVGGSTASVIDTFAASNSASNGIHLGQNSTASQSIVFDVADVTGDSAADLTISAKLLNTSSSQVASGLTKTGVGTLTLSAANIYSGATTINGGILNITGSLNSNSGTVAVNNGGTLAGTGTIARATTVSSGGAISPGNGGAGTAGTLTLSGGLTLNTGAVLRIDLAGTATSDKVAVSGAFAASGTTTINLTALGSFAGSGTYPLITGASGISAGNFALGSTLSGYVCNLGASGGTLSLIVMTQLENWRQTNFGTTSNSNNAADSADPDGDGWTNAREFTAGTDPNDRNSLLKISQMVASGGDELISFPTVIGKIYRVERSGTLADGSWAAVQDNVAGTGGIVEISDAGGASAPTRFYRIAVSGGN